MIVVDYQKDFVEGSLSFPGAELLDSGIAERINAYGPGNVFYTMDTHHEDYLSTREGKNLPIIHCIKDTPGWHLYGKTAQAIVDVGAKSVEKNNFVMTHDELLSLGIPYDVKNIEFVGLVSNICVISNIVMVMSEYPEANIQVNSALVGTGDPKLQDAALKIMQSLQVKVF